MIIHLKNENISASIDTLGAELKQLNKGNKNYIWEVNTNFWNKTSPILFPIVGRLKQDSYLFEGKEYNLPRHGFAREYEFEIFEQTETKVIFKLSSNLETLKIYPFLFDFYYTYEVVKNKLEVTYEIFNLNKDKMPFSIGAHPAFKLDKSIENYSLQFNCDEEFKSYHLTNENFDGNYSIIKSENGKINLNDTLFEIDALVFKHLQSEELILIENENALLKFNFKDFPYLGIWKKVKAPFLCIEPWQGLADNSLHNGNIIEKEGIILLEQNQSKKLSYFVEIL